MRSLLSGGRHMPSSSRYRPRTASAVCRTSYVGPDVLPGPGGRASRAASRVEQHRATALASAAGSSGGTRHRRSLAGRQALPGPADVGDHDGPAAGHGLQRGQRHAFPPRRQDDQVGGPVPGHGVGDGRPRRAHRRRAAAVRRSRSVRAVADQHQPGRPGRPRSTVGPAAQQDVLALLPAQPPHAHHQRRGRDRRGRAVRRSAAPCRVDRCAGRKRSRSTPLRITVHRARHPRSRPRGRSASLTHTTRSAQRAPYRSQPSASAAVAPPTASKDQACGWKTVGIRARVRRAGRPARPWRCARARRSGRYAASSPRPAGASRRRAPGPGAGVRRQVPTSAPERPAPGASGPPGGQATTACRPSASWARTRSVTTRATPPSTGWERWRTVAALARQVLTVACSVPLLTSRRSCGIRRRRSGLASSGRRARRAEIPDCGW